MYSVCFVLLLAHFLLYHQHAFVALTIIFLIDMAEKGTPTNGLKLIPKSAIWFTNSAFVCYLTW